MKRRPLHPVWAKVFNDLRAAGAWPEDSPVPPEKKNGRPVAGLTLTKDHASVALRWIVDRDSRGRIQNCYLRRGKRIGPVSLALSRLVLYVEVRQGKAIANGKRLSDRKAVCDALDGALKRLKTASADRHRAALHPHHATVEAALRALRRYRKQKST